MKNKPITWTNCKVKLGDLKPWEKNPRKSTKEQAERILQSLNEFGQVDVFAVGPDNEVYNGHQRLGALLVKYGRKHVVDARRASRKLSDQERKKLTAFLHAGATGGWDWDSLEGWDKHDLQLWGLDSSWLKSLKLDMDNVTELLESQKPEIVDAEPQIDRAGELQKKWKTKLGQLWKLGDHRLLCGDCTVRENVERLMGGERARLCFTSPPYADQRKKQYGGTPSDKYVDWWKGVQDVTNIALSDDGSFFVNIKPHCEDGQRVLYVFDLVLSMVRDWGWILVDELCWVRQSMPNGTKYRFRNGFEPVYHFSKHAPFANFEQVRTIASEMTKPKRYRKSGSGSGLHNFDYKPEEGALPDNVIMINTGEVNIGTTSHPATFPIRLPEFFITCFSATNDIVYDPFVGSGTTIIAAQNLSRRCCAMEISPAYAGVILERFHTAFPDEKIELVK